jgi:hypothetical protein
VTYICILSAYHPICLCSRDSQTSSFRDVKVGGAPSSVNSLAQPHEGLFEIELQSGDRMRIEAPSWAFRPESA